jgi:hypothetical protein
MALTESDLPIILATVNDLINVLAAAPVGLNNPSATGEKKEPEAVRRVEAITETMHRLRRALAPSDPEFLGSYNPDLFGTGFPPKTDLVLSKLWQALVHSLSSVRPPFPEKYHNEWLVLLEEARSVLSTVERTDSIISHGERTYSVPGRDPIKLTEGQDTVLQMFLRRSPRSKPELDDCGYPVEYALKLLRSLKGTDEHTAKYDGRFAPYIIMPGRANAGGYHVRIRRAPTD